MSFKWFRNLKLKALDRWSGRKEENRLFRVDNFVDLKWCKLSDRPLLISEKGIFTYKFRLLTRKVHNQVL